MRCVNRRAEQACEFAPHEAAPAATSAEDCCAQTGSKSRARRWPAATVRLVSEYASNAVVQRSAAGEFLMVTSLLQAAPADHGVRRQSVALPASNTYDVECSQFSKRV